MNGQDFIDRFRLDRDDRATPYFWTDDEILSYATEAETEACIRAKLLEDKTTAQCCTVTLEADTADYDLDASVFLVKRVTYLGRALTETSVEAMDAQDSNWEARTGEPCEFIQSEGKLRVIPIPVDDGELALTVYRTPLDPITDASEPEIPARLHLRLLDWMYHLAFLKQDVETFDAASAEKHSLKFEASFGERADANVQRKRRDRRLPVTRMVW